MTKDLIRTAVPPPEWLQKAWAGKAAGIETRIGNHTFRATGITAYFKKEQGHAGVRADDRQPRLAAHHEALRSTERRNFAG
jgi:hypothetical protein